MPETHLRTIDPSSEPFLEDASITIPNAILAGLLVIPDKSDPRRSGLGIEWLDDHHIVLLAVNRNLLVAHRVPQKVPEFSPCFLPSDLLRFRPKPLDRGSTKVRLQNGWVTIREHSAPNRFPEHLRHWREWLAEGAESKEGTPQFDLSVLEKLRAARLLLAGDPRTRMRCKEAGPCIDRFHEDAFAVVMQSEPRSKVILPDWVNGIDKKPLA